MSDNLTPEQRKKCMSSVTGKNTKPELVVRKMLHAMGYRYRLHVKTLPGKPDVVLPRHQKIIQIQGCFWHGHSCKRGKKPTTNREFWVNKIERNVARDSRNHALLTQTKWKVLTIWGCQVNDKTALLEKLKNFMESK